MVSQVAQCPGQGHFRVSGLEAALHRSLNPALGFRIAKALDEELGIATEVFDRWEPDRIDPVLNDDMTRGWKVGDPMSQRPNELVEPVSRQGSIDPSITFS